MVSKKEWASFPNRKLLSILKIMKMLGDDVFKKLCMRVTLDAQPLPDTAVQKFIDEQLRELPYLFFASQPQITNKEEQERVDVEDDGGAEADEEEDQ